MGTDNLDSVTKRVFGGLQATNNARLDSSVGVTTPSTDGGVVVHRAWQGVSLSIIALITTSLLWGCAGSKSTQESTATPVFLTFERGDRVACCGVALPTDGSVVVVGRVDTVAGKSWAWVAKVLRTGVLAWELDWSSENDSTGFYAATEVAGGAVIAVGDRAGQAGLIAKIEPTGTIAWTKLLRLDRSTRVIDVIDDAANGLIIAGKVAAASKPWSLFVARMTPSGDIARHTIIGKGDWVTRMRRVDKDGYVVITGEWDVIRLDRSEQIRWRQRVDGAMDAVGLSDGSVIVLTYPETESGGAGLVRFNSDGAKLWARSEPRVCRPAGIWGRSNDNIMVVGNPCADSEHLSVVSILADGTARSVHRIRVRAGVTAAQVRFDATGSVIATGMFAQDLPEAGKGWVFRSGPILGLAP